MNTLLDTIVTSFVLPLVLVIASAALLIFKSYIEKITKSMILRNDTESLKTITSTKNNLLEEIDNIVGMAVGSNMQLADKLKYDSPEEKLTADEVKMLNDAARRIIFDSLSSGLLNENGPLLKVIGGKDRLNMLVNNLIEKHVYEYKSE